MALKENPNSRAAASTRSRTWALAGPDLFRTRLAVAIPHPASRATSFIVIFWGECMGEPLWKRFHVYLQVIPNRNVTGTQKQSFGEFAASVTSGSTRSSECFYQMSALQRKSDLQASLICDI
jgi:hypothetical protein